MAEQLLLKNKQSLRPEQIRHGIHNFLIIKKLFQKLQSVIKKLDLSVDATKYYAGWIVKAKVTQITDIVEPNKRYLYLVTFIDHYYKKCGLRAMAWLPVSIASL